MADEKLYESAAVWDQELQLGQRNLIRAICDHWSNEIHTALDVGCGDGKITHAVAERVNTAFHGFDGSREALSRLRLPSTHGDVSALPFNDGAFDAVLTTDVFEHLPDNVEQDAWQELFRVARDWVFFAVPYREELLDASTICMNCGEQYHVNWHHRGYDFAGLSKRTPPGWRIVRAILSGEQWSPMLPPETYYRRFVLNEWSGWSEAVCPTCGAPSLPLVEPATLDADVARALGQCIYEMASERRFLRSHSEILLIFRRADALQKNDEYPSCETERVSATQWVPRMGVGDNLDPYPQTARMVSAVGGGYIAQFPVYPGGLQGLNFAAHTSGMISIVAEDGNGLVFSGDIDLSPNASTKVLLPRDVHAGYHGLIVRINTIENLLSIALEGCGDSVDCLYSANNDSCYFDIQGTVLRIHVTSPVLIDADSILAPTRSAKETLAVVVRILVQADLKCKQLAQELAQLTYEHERQIKKMEVRFGGWVRHIYRVLSKLVKINKR